MTVDGVHLRAGAASDVGRVRSNNQDSYVLIHDRDLFIVADGMGGAQGGEVASQLAIDTIQAAYDEPTPDALVAAVEQANDTIHERAAADPDLRGMGTTVTAAALMDLADDSGESHPQVVIANVGDSRAYLFRQGELTQLTEDHSMVADLVRQGRLDPDEAEHHPQRNILTRVLGVYANVSVDVWPIDPVRGDRYVLCSDGLFNEVGADQIAAVLRRYENDPQGSAGELVRQAVEAGGRDNVTVVVIDVVDDGGVAEAASAALAADGSRGVDLAGFTTAEPAVAEPEEARVAGAPRLSRRERRRARRAERATRTRLTWRVLAFLVLLVGLLAAAFYAIVWYGTSTYYVGFDGDEVVIYQGRPDGVLWIDPELEERTDIQRDELPPRTLERVEAEREQASLSDARRFVANVEEDIIRANDATTTTTTAPPTTAPPPAVPG